MKGNEGRWEGNPLNRISRESEGAWATAAPSLPPAKRRAGDERAVGGQVPQPDHPLARTPRVRAPPRAGICTCGRARPHRVRLRVRFHAIPRPVCTRRGPRSRARAPPGAHLPSPPRVRTPRPSGVRLPAVGWAGGRGRSRPPLGSPRRHHPALQLPFPCHPCGPPRPPGSTDVRERHGRPLLRPPPPLLHPPCCSSPPHLPARSGECATTSALPPRRSRSSRSRSRPAPRRRRPACLAGPGLGARGPRRRPALSPRLTQ